MLNFSRLNLQIILEEQNVNGKKLTAGQQSLRFGRQSIACRMRASVIALDTPLTVVSEERKAALPVLKVGCLLVFSLLLGLAESLNET